jgi:hypothetical protein
LCTMQELIDLAQMDAEIAAKEKAAAAVRE